MFSLGYVAPLRPALGDDALLLVRPVLGHRVAPQLRMREARHLAARAQLAVAVAQEVAGAGAQLGRGGQLLLHGRQLRGPGRGAETAAARGTLALVAVVLVLVGQREPVVGHVGDAHAAVRAARRQLIRVRVVRVRAGG